MRYVVFQRPPTNGVSHGTHYERLSPTVLRLDRTLGPHLHRRHRGLSWGWLLALVCVVALFWVGVGVVVWTIWRLIHP